LTELNGQPIAPGEHGKQAFVLLRSEDSRVTGTASCNTFNGSYAIKGGQRIEFGHNIAMTLMACQDLDVERQFIDVLKSVDNYSVDGAGGMTFNRARIAPLARFVEAGEAE
jgi:heat shock protein HslJ